MADFTPGPWRIVETDSVWELYGRCDDGHPAQLIKAIKRSDTYAVYWPNDADAALIAAAPDLYVALEALTSQQEEPVEGCDCGRCEAIWQADAALRKARGEAQP